MQKIQERRKRLVVKSKYLNNLNAMTSRQGKRFQLFNNNPALQAQSIQRQSQENSERSRIASQSVLRDKSANDYNYSIGHGIDIDCFDTVHSKSLQITKPILKKKDYMPANSFQNYRDKSYDNSQGGYRAGSSNGQTRGSSYQRQDEDSKLAQCKDLYCLSNIYSQEMRIGKEEQ